MARLLTLFTMLALLVGTRVGEVPAQDAAPAPAPPYYFPVQLGTRWVYLWKHEGRKDEEAVEVVMAVESGNAGAKVVTVGRAHEDGKNWPTEKFEVSPRGLMWKENLVGYGGYPEPPHFQVKLPHRDGQTWAIDPAARNGTRLRARGPERVKVPAGAYDCIRVEYLQNHPTPTPTPTRWYARGVGMVKLECGDLQVVLKSFTPGEVRAR
jgi:hypothetical protein